MLERKCISKSVVCVSAILVTIFAQATIADVGDLRGAVAGGPWGNVSVRITQGGNDVLSGGTVTVPLPNNIKSHNWTTNDYVVLDTWGAGTADETDVILKVISDGGVTDPWRTTHWYIATMVPGSIDPTSQSLQPGAISLFDTSKSDQKIKVEISNVTFANTAWASPTIQDSRGYYTSYMRSYMGYFYKFDDAETYNSDGNNIIDVQVRGDTYNDANTGEYTYSTSAPGPIVSWDWDMLLAPVPNTTNAYDEFGGLRTNMNGFVHELGLGVAFYGEMVPEPTTALMMLLSPLAFRRRRRR